MPASNGSEDDKARSPSVLRVAVYSLLLNAGLVVFKFVLSDLAGSLALRADAVHSLVDVLASIALITGLKISERKSRSFPLGLYKVENLASIAISFLLFATAYEIVLEAMHAETQVAQFGGFVLLTVAALIPLPYLFGSYQIHVGKESGSPPPAVSLRILSDPCGKGERLAQLNCRRHTAQSRCPHLLAGVPGPDRQSLRDAIGQDRCRGHCPHHR